jgi:hypothetical protein
MVEVYFWNGIPGHIALKVTGGTPPGTLYLSSFPGSIWTALDVGYKGENHTYEMDTTSYGLPHIVRLSKLNETAVKTAVAAAIRSMIYNDFLYNCASHVKYCLECGLLNSPNLARASIYSTGALFSHSPQGVFTYAAALEALYR